MQQTEYPRRTGWKESTLWECRLCSSRCHDCRTAGRKVPYHWPMHRQCSTKSYGRFGKKFRNDQNPCRLSVRAKYSPLSAASDPFVQLPRYRRCRNRAAVLLQAVNPAATRSDRKSATIFLCEIPSFRSQYTAPLFRKCFCQEGRKSAASSSSFGRENAPMKKRPSCKEQKR